MSLTRNTAPRGSGLLKDNTPLTSDYTRKRFWFIPGGSLKTFESSSVTGETILSCGGDADSKGQVVLLSGVNIYGIQLDTASQEINYTIDVPDDMRTQSPLYLRLLFSPLSNGSGDLFYYKIFYDSLLVKEYVAGATGAAAGVVVKDAPTSVTAIIDETLNIASLTVGGLLLGGEGTITYATSSASVPVTGTFINPNDSINLKLLVNGTPASSAIIAAVGYDIWYRKSKV